MHKEESRQPSGEAVAYKTTVEQVVVELLELSGAVEKEGDNIMDNLKELGGYIKRHVIEPYNEMITLAMNGEITHIGQVWREGDEILHVILTADEMKRRKLNGTK